MIRTLLFIFTIAIAQISTAPLEANTQISSGLTGNERVSARFNMSDDGTRIYYSVADLFGDKKLFLTAPDDPENSILLNNSMDTADQLVSFAGEDPTGERAFFQIGEILFDPIDFYSVDFEGSNEQLLIDDIAPGRVHRAPRLTRDRDWFHFLQATGGDFGEIGLYGMETGGDQNTFRFDVQLTNEFGIDLIAQETETGGHIVYQTSTGNIYSVEPSTRMPVLLNEKSVEPFFVFFNKALELSSTGDRLVYRARDTSDNTLNIYSTLIDGSSSSTKLNSLLPSNGEVADFQITPDGSRVIYIAQHQGSTAREVFSVPIAGGAPVKLNEALTAGGNVTRFQLGHTGTLMVYQGEHVSVSSVEHYSVNLENLQKEQLSPSLQNTSFAIFSPDDSHIAYTGETSGSGVNALYVAPSEDGRYKKITDEDQLLPALGSINPLGAAFSYDSKFIVFLGSKPGEFNKNLFYGPSGGGSISRINGVFQQATELSPGTVNSFRVSPTTNTVFYTADETRAQLPDLYTADLVDVFSELCFPIKVSEQATTFICL